MELLEHLSKADIQAFEPEAKIGLLATVGAEGHPHLSLITTLQAKTAIELTWGQFCEGESKKNVRHNPNTAYVVMNADKRVWRGMARWTHEEKSGEDYERYNQLPMFRYNSYFGIHTVHYMDLVGALPAESLSVPAVAAGAVYAKAARRLARSGRGGAVINAWSVDHVNKLDTLKFLAYVREDGFPWVIPVVPAATADSRRIVFAHTAFRKELEVVPDGATVAIFALNMQMESVLLRGTYGGTRAGLGIVDIDWVYNSMPPQPGQIYPRQPVKPVQFSSASPL